MPDNADYVVPPDTLRRRAATARRHAEKLRQEADEMDRKALDWEAEAACNELTQMAQGDGLYD